MSEISFSIYDASAGSGKTYTLVKEYLKIILRSQRSDAYRNILAITFTNKAVHEMKSRIVSSLSEFAADEPSDKAENLMRDLSGELRMSLPEIKQKAKQIIRHIIHNYAAFDISTIDKFTHRVIRAFARDLNLPMTFEVSLDTENLLQEAVDALIAQAGEDETLTKLLVDFAMEKTDDDKSWDVSREIMETGRLALNENHRGEIAHLSQKSIPEFMMLKEKLGKLSDELEAQNKLLAQTILQNFDNNAVDRASFSAGHFPKHLQGIAEGKFNPNNKTYHELDDIRINKTAKDRNIIESLLPDVLATLSAIYANFGKRNMYLAFLKNITPLSLLNTVNNEIERIQKEQNILSISEFNAIIHREIQNQPAPFIYERLGERYRNYFIDEFQDTSEMQWQNLVPLIGNAVSGQDELGQIGTLMIVGDPKQSIYRWRGGKAEQFIALGKEENREPFPNVAKKLFKLDTNWRSYSEVVHFNNDFFEFVSSEFEHGDYKDLYEKQSRQETTAKQGGYVNIRFVQPNDEDEDVTTEKDELHLQATLKTINEVIGLGFRYSEIAILTRKRDKGILVANYLTQNEIPLLSSETLQIATSTEVRFIVNLLRYLKNANDAEAKAMFLQYIGKHLQQRMPLHDFIAQGMSHHEEKAFADWLASFDFEMSFADIRKKSLYEAVERIASTFIVEHNAYVQYFLDIVLERDVRNQAGIADFLVFWDSNSDKFSIPSPEGKDAVKIMTIHKSKGLEFPVVIMPFAEEDYNRKPREKIWIPGEDEELDLPKVLVDSNSSVEGFGEAAALVYNQKKQEELLDNINVLYVALTRAEEQLYVISGMNLDKNGTAKRNNMSTFFIDFLLEKGLFDAEKFDYGFGNRKKLSQVKQSLQEPFYIKPVEEPLDTANIKIAQRESLMWGSKQLEAIEYGNTIHEILASVAYADDIDLALIKAVENGLISQLQLPEVGQTLKNIVEHQELADYFAVGNVVLNEQAIIRTQPGLIKPDRMVLTPDRQVYLLDYKTGNPNPKYEKQLENYAHAIESMGFRVTKKALVFTGEPLNVIHL
ncbi:UvrD-helicase domain-containing protein [Flavobacterium sp. MAH-1]|uniref:DNA 3'-5' helicase n=1 Tax=Flavobacterium agri TaxID=2743471 RepID=A0A7Y8Y2H4_9FLAO|nr:UvrD-helicase domain-containing protein [Flavobacterium agri]NUY81327.1 UvrD-helicase domain-containing protein [Flavobacterium agri]NYA71351.1 UvrD-helicase domain-containing protein [Flavobacterium agri]